MQVHFPIISKINRKSIEAFTHVSTVWNQISSQKPNLVFAVIPMDEQSTVANTFDIHSSPSLAYLPEKHSLSNVCTIIYNSTYSFR